MADIHEPYLLKFATPRSSHPELGGRYSPAADLWVVEVEGGERPIVEVADGSLLSTQTKTMAEMETDDDDPGRGCAVELVTNAAIKEGASLDIAMMGLLEVQTKTEVDQERDDQVKPVL
jgi:hypothetical protein